MDCGSSGRPLGEIAVGFSALAEEYRRAAACIADVAGCCDAAGVTRSKVLDIAFGSVPRRIAQGADSMDAVAARLRGTDGTGVSVSTSPFPSDDASAQANSVHVTANGACTLEGAPQLLIASARALEDAMLRALDLVDEVARPDLVGDSHPFGHIIHGICVPYLLLAAEDLEGLVASGRLGK